MKHILLSILVIVALVGCQKTPELAKNVTVEPAGKSPDEESSNDTVQLKEGHGLAFHPKVKESIGLKTGEVVEQQIEPKFTTPLHVIMGADSGVRKVAFDSRAGVEANGWLSTAKAALIKPGQEVELRADLPNAAIEKGVVKRIEKSPYATLGDFEVVVETATPFETGTRLAATFHAPQSQPVPTVPRSALLHTAEGWFVYVVNEKFYMRTPVEVGSMNDESAEITDGLYAGDQIVTAPVNTLWMAELQILRGGKACTCGH